MKIIQQRAWAENFPELAAFKVEMAARTCYQSFSKVQPSIEASDEFVRKLIRRGHEAMLEHVSATFRIITSRAIANEIVRHRMASYAQESTRYVDYKGDIEFVITDSVDPTRLSYDKKMAEVCKAAEIIYKEMRAVGIPPQIARDVLPLCLKTELVMTANFREWRHFLKLRTAPDAHPMMRELAEIILEVFREKAPVFVEDIEKRRDSA